MALTKDDVKEAVEESMKQALQVHERDDHHLFIRDMIERRKKREERWEKVRQNVIGWAIIGIIGGVGHQGYQLLIYVRDHVMKQ